eukprot:1249405-Amphidinium_carterae.1
MTMNHPKYGKLRFVQSVVHASLWHIVSQDSWNGYEKNKKTIAKIHSAATAIQDFEHELDEMFFFAPLGLMA